MNRYKELIFNEKTYTETYIINETLLKEGFGWFLDCEVENCRIEIMKNTLVFNSGVFFNGTWEYGVFRDGQWKYGTWNGGVWYNGTWYNGIFKNGLIFGGRFMAGNIEGGEIRGGDFFDVKISNDVEKKDNQQEKPVNKIKSQTGTPINRAQLQKVQGQIQPVENKIEEKIKRFDTFIKSK